MASRLSSPAASHDGGTDQDEDNHGDVAGSGSKEGSVLNQGGIDVTVMVSDGLMASSVLEQSTPLGSAGAGLAINLAIVEESLAKDNEVFLLKDQINIGSPMKVVRSDTTKSSAEVVTTSQSQDPSKPVEQLLSYATIVQQTSTLSKHDVQILEGDGSVFASIPDEFFQNSSPLWEDLIVGRFPDKAPHIAKVHVIVNKIWTYGNKTLRIDAFVENASIIKFRIRDPEIRERILRRGMWNIAGKSMMVSKYCPISEETLPVFQSMPLWIKVKNLPQNLLPTEGISFLTSVVGHLVKLHPETELCKVFDETKVFVNVDLTKELYDSFRFKSKQGDDFTVDFQYPWLPPSCCLCSKWGHNKDACSRLEKQSTKKVASKITSSAQAGVVESVVSTSQGKKKTQSSVKELPIINGVEPREFDSRKPLVYDANDVTVVDDAATVSVTTVDDAVTVFVTWDGSDTVQSSVDASGPAIEFEIRNT